MEQNAQRIATMVEGVDEEQARWKPDEKSWSILEVANHLNDEEREDFRVFIDYTLNRPGEKKPKIDPQGWAVERKYNERDLNDSLKNFIEARKDSIEWLKSLENPDWDTTYEAPWGPIRAGDVLSA